MQYSKDGKYFAQITAESRLKIWNTSTNSFEQEYTPNFHLAAPCVSLHFVQPTATNRVGSPKKKIKRKTELSNHYVCLGTTNGLLLVYSITKGDLDFTINSETSEVINCSSWQSGTEMYSSANQNILCWDLENRSVKSNWKAGNETITAMYLIPKKDELLTAAKTIKLWNINTQQLLKTYVGHNDNITSMEYISTQSSGCYCLTGAKSGRILSCWNLETDSVSASTHFIMDDVIHNLSVSVDNDGMTKVAATTRNGVCHIFRYVLNGRSTRPLKPATTIRVATDNKDVVAPIHIFSANYKDDNSLMIAHGIEMKLTFEDVIVSTTDKLQCLVRAAPKLQSKAKSDGAIGQKVPIDSTEYLGTHSSKVLPKKKKEGKACEVPMEMRLENLSLNKLDTVSRSSVKNIAHLLLQAMHSQDQVMLHTVFKNRDESVIRNAVKRLPIVSIKNLLDQMTIFMRGKSLWCQTAAIWMRIIVQEHAGILASNPSLSALLEEVLSAIDAKLVNHRPLSRLKGRLDLLISQIEKQPSRDNNSSEALLVYNDKASSDSELDGIEVGSTTEDPVDGWDEDTEEVNIFNEPSGNSSSEAEDSDDAMST